MPSDREGRGWVAIVHCEQRERGPDLQTGLFVVLVGLGDESGLSITLSSIYKLG